MPLKSTRNVTENDLTADNITTDDITRSALNNRSIFLHDCSHRTLQECPQQLYGRQPHKRRFERHMARESYGLMLLLIAVMFSTSACNYLWNGDDSRTQRERNASLLADVSMLNVDMYDSYYGNSDTNLTEPPVWTVQSGADVVVNLVNHGLLNHNWAVVKKGITVPTPYEEGQSGDIILHGIGMVYNNSQTTITFTAPESGEYQVICTVSGHYPFMQGKLQVVDAE